MGLKEVVLYEVGEARKDFPILDQKVRGEDLVYLDNAATSQKPLNVIEEINSFYREYNSNIFRGIHTLSEKATEKHEEARDKIADFIGAESKREVIFVRNATEAINLVAWSWGRDNLQEGDTVLLTEMEHHSNLIPWQLLAKEKGFDLEFVSVDREGRLSMEEFKEKVDSGVSFFGVVHVSNMLGTINPVEEMVSYARENGASTLVDAAQSVPHMPVDVSEMGCDFLAFSGHKMLGPTGIGVLYGRKELLDEMRPFLGGGEMIKEVKLRHANWKEAPYKFEAGTTNIVGAIGLGAAVDYLDSKGMKAIRRHEFELTEYAIDVMSDVPDTEVYGPLDPDERAGVVSFNVADIHAHDMATLLDEKGIAVRSGHHCTMPLHTKLDLAATTRASFYLYNTKTEIDRLVDGIHYAREVFQL